MGLKLGDIIPAYGMLKGEGWAGDLLGRKSEKEDQAKKLAQATADQKAAQEKAAAQASAQQWANRSTMMKKGGAVKKADGGSVYTEKMGKPPQDVDGASVRKSSKRGQPEQLGEGIKVEKKAKGGMTGSSASRRADGCATKGKTRGKVL